MSSNLRGAHGTVQKTAGYGVKISHFFIQRKQNPHLLEFRNPGAVQTRHIRQGIRFGINQNLIVQIRPFMGNCIYFDTGVFLFKFGNEHIHQCFIFRRLRTVMVPEIDCDLILFLCC